MNKPITIVGAGMAGLLAANMLTKRGYKVRVFETQKDLPNNHSAVLRFRSNVVGKALGIPFRQVMMTKRVLPWRNEVADTLAYSRKCFGFARSDRSITNGNATAERFIAPPDMIAIMFGALPHNTVKLGHYWQPDAMLAEPVISTLPMPVLMKLLGWKGERIGFHHVEGINVKAKLLNCDAYVTLTVPDPDLPFSRVSITGNELIVECPNFALRGFDMSRTGELFLQDLGVSIARQAAPLLGFEFGELMEVQTFKQPYAKIVEADKTVREDFMYWATDAHNIFSLGRFATWRPKLMLDDLVNDVERIEHWINNRSRYAVAKAR